MKSHRRWIGHCVLAGLASVSAAAVAQNAPATLNRIVVTATRTAETENQTLAPVTVITRKQIDRLQPASLPALLDSTPGMAVSNQGGPGKLTSMFLRGTNSNQVLVLVDGVEIGAATSGMAAIQNIPLSQIQRIEIVRGPFSSLYGANAVGGVIQIFLRHTPGTFVPNASFGVGSYRHWKASAGFSAASEKGWLSLQAGHEQTKGINSCRSGAAQLLVACMVDQPDRDGFHDSSLNLHGEYRFGKHWSMNALGMRSEGFNKFDGSPFGGNSDDYVTQVVGGQLHYRPNDGIDVSLAVGSSTNFETDFYEDVYVDHFDTRRDIGSLQANLGVGRGLVSAGVDWKRDAIASNEAFTENARTDRGLFAEYQVDFGAQSFQANARHDDNSQFGGKSTGSLLWGWDFTRGLRVTASWGTAYDTPTFNDLYFPGFGNPGLRPESSRNFDVGLRGTPGWGHWQLNVYRNDITDLITSSTATFFIPENIDRARITGLEGVVGGKWAGWDLQATATLLNARNAARGSASHGNELPLRPSRSARIDADRRFGRFSFGASVNLNSRAWGDVANTQRLGGYALANLRGGWSFQRDWKLQLAIYNVFDKDYETAYFYNQPGRNFMLTLRYSGGR